MVVFKTIALQHGFSPVRWGVLGYGKISSKSTVPAFDDCHLSELSAVGSSCRHKRDRLRQSLPHCRVLDYDGLLNSEDIDAIYIALPNHLHHQWTLKALKAGKHVLCEKPMALRAEDALESERLARSKGLICIEAFMYRHHPQHQTAKQWVDEGQIGELRMIRSHFSYDLEDLSNIRLRPECGGGALLDAGCYGVDVSRWFANQEPCSIQVESVRHQQVDVDVQSVVQMRFPSGLLAQVYCSMNAPRCHRYDIFGSRGHIEVRDAFIPAKGKKTHVLCHGKEGQKRVKHCGVNVHALQLEACSRCIQDGHMNAPMGNGVGNSRILGILTKEMINC